MKRCTIAKTFQIACSQAGFPNIDIKDACQGFTTGTTPVVRDGATSSRFTTPQEPTSTPTVKPPTPRPASSSPTEEVIVQPAVNQTTAKGTPPSLTSPGTRPTQSVTSPPTEGAKSDEPGAYFLLCSA